MSTRDVLFRYATPLATGLFVVTAVSGVALFVHVGGTWVRGMHEILALPLVPLVALHVWRNWGAFAAYFRRRPMWIALAISLVLATPFMLSSEGDERTHVDREGLAAVVNAIEGADLATVATLAGTDAETVIARFAAAGIRDAGAIDTVSDLAERSGRDALSVMSVALGR